jgi:hypothetical protein
VSHRLLAAFFDLNSGLCTCWQVLYHLSHSSSPFCPDYFGARILFFAQAGLDYDPILGFLCSWDARCAPPHCFFH